MQRQPVIYSVTFMFHFSQQELRAPRPNKEAGFPSRRRACPPAGGTFASTLVPVVPSNFAYRTYYRQ
jgi:hypothetical protein